MQLHKMNMNCVAFDWSYNTQKNSLQNFKFQCYPIGFALVLPHPLPNTISWQPLCMATLKHAHVVYVRNSRIILFYAAEKLNKCNQDEGEND